MTWLLPLFHHCTSFCPPFPLSLHQMVIFSALVTFRIFSPLQLLARVLASVFLALYRSERSSNVHQFQLQVWLLYPQLEWKLRGAGKHERAGESWGDKREVLENLALCPYIYFVLTKLVFEHSFFPSSGWRGAELLKRQPFQHEAINQTKYPGERERRKEWRETERENMGRKTRKHPRGIWWADGLGKRERRHNNSGFINWWWRWEKKSNTWMSAIYFDYRQKGWSTGVNSTSKSVTGFSLNVDKNDLNLKPWVTETNVLMNGCMEVRKPVGAVRP